MEQWQLDEIRDTREAAYKRRGAKVCFKFDKETGELAYIFTGEDDPILPHELNYERRGGILKDIAHIAAQVYKDYPEREESLLFVPRNKQFVFSWHSEAFIYDCVYVVVPGMK